MQGLIKLMDILFVIGIILFMLLGSIIVLVQIFGVITLNGSLTINITKVIGNTTFIIASITGLIGFIEGYLHNWKASE
ncbi:MAG TPA: hypothetical protein GXX35_07060 [Thermoanaerobacterales bacterium]|nr:hypothetical protein [Thermoanaerobacterales bacterium]